MVLQLSVIKSFIRLPLMKEAFILLSKPFNVKCVLVLLVLVGSVQQSEIFREALQSKSFYCLKLTFWW